MMTTTYPTTGRRLAWTALNAAVLSGLAACHTSPTRNAPLEDARRVFQDANANPHVTTSAQLELDRARKTLYEAEHVWSERRDDQETNHLAYLATQQAKVAINIGMQHAADTMVTSAGIERERVQTEAANQQAQVATQQAQASAQQAQSATQRANSLEQELQKLSARHTPKGMVVVLQDVLFDPGKSDLKPGATARLQRLADVLKNHPERRLQVEGFTDSTGSADLNQTLSDMRAQAVKDALTNMGVGADRIDAHGYGSARPVASNKTTAGRQQNRRVEVVFSDANGAFGGQ